MSLVVERFGGTAAEWNAFAEAQPGYTHFHRFEWRSVIESVFGHECVYLVARDVHGGAAGVLPLVRVKSVLFGHYLVSMPFVNYGGPLGSDAAVRALIDEAVRLARAGGVKLLELRSRTPLPTALPVSHRKITVLLDLPDASDALFKRFDAKLRAQIRRPMKENVTVAFGPDQVEPFFTVFSQHMRDLGTPTQPKRLFDAIARTFGDDVWFGCAYLEGQPIAGGCGFRWGHEIEMTWASSLRAYNKVSPNMLLYWSFMERAVGAGLRTFNFGRCSPDGGTYRFKKQWGSRDEPLWWYDFSNRGPATTPSPDDGAYAWGPRVWKKLPTAVATAIGPRIVRYIP
jgi:FemAB-related protein (PEP-CTERM system-associated)